MPEKQLVSVLAIIYHRDLPHFAFTGHWPLAIGHCSHAPRPTPERRCRSFASSGREPGRESMRVLPLEPRGTGSELSHRSHHAQRSGWRDRDG